jgi:hypothetical protein
VTATPQRKIEQQFVVRLLIGFGSYSTASYVDLLSTVPFTDHYYCAHTVAPEKQEQLRRGHLANGSIDAALPNKYTKPPQVGLHCTYFPLFNTGF